MLLFMEEENVFWTMCSIIEGLVPSSYFSTNLIGVHADQRVLRQLLVQYLPSLDKLLMEHDIGMFSKLYQHSSQFILRYYLSLSM